MEALELRRGALLGSTGKDGRQVGGLLQLWQDKGLEMPKVWLPLLEKLSGERCSFEVAAAHGEKEGKAKGEAEAAA